MCNQAGIKSVGLAFTALELGITSQGLGSAIVKGPLNGQTVSFSLDQGSKLFALLN